MAANSIFKELEKGSFAGLKRSVSLYPSAVNLKNTAGLTPLHIAAQQGQAAFVKELLVHGAQHDTTDSRGNIPLHLAAEQGHLEAVIELLAGRKASVKAKNKEGQTPLHVAVICGHKAVVSKLLETGIQAEGLKDKAGHTPISLADPDDAEMQQIFAEARPLGSTASINHGLGSLTSARVSEVLPAGPPRTAQVGFGAATAVAGSSFRSLVSPAASFNGSLGGGQPGGLPATPPPRGAVSGTPAGARTPGASGGGGRTPPPAHGPSGALTSRLPRNSASVAASPAQSGGGAASEQLQKHDLAIQSLKEGLRAATERLGALDACTAAQLECAGQVEKALEACGNHGRAILDLEARVAFQEDRGRDTRGRLERLEEGERDRQDSVKRLTDDQRGLHLQVQRLADQLTANGSGLTAQRQMSSADAASQLLGQPHMHAELAILRAQVDQLSPALALATAASAEVRTLAARLDVMQQQMQQQQHAAVVQPALGSSVVLEQQVLQLQAQVQLLQLPVANLTQQCADMAGRMAGFAEWQQQARADLARLLEAAAASAQQDAGGRRNAELTDAVMGVLDTASKTLAEHRQQIDAVDKKVALLMQEREQQQGQQVAVLASPPPPSGPPTLPATPQSAGQRVSGGGDSLMGPFGAPPSRIQAGPPSMGRDAAAQAEMRSEVESLKSLVADIRKEVVTEGGSLRREWQRAFSDMQSRYGEQTNELRAREANIAKLREAALVEEAERRAASGFEEKFTARLGKLETSVEYLTHRLEVLEEQLSGVVTTLAGATSPVMPHSPSRMAAALATMRSLPAPTRSGPGPVSENHNGFVAEASDLAAAAAAAAMAMSPRFPAASPKQGRCRSVGGPAPAVTPGGSAVQSDGGCLRMRVARFGAASVRGPVFSVAGGGGDGAAASSRATSAREIRSARDVSDRKLGPEEWWRAADEEMPEPLEVPAAPAAAAAVELAASTPGIGGGAGPLLPLTPAVVPKAEGAKAEAGQTAIPDAQQAEGATAPDAAGGGQQWGAMDTAADRRTGTAADLAARNQDPILLLQHIHGASDALACVPTARGAAMSMPGVGYAASAMSQRGPSSAREPLLSAHDPPLSVRGHTLSFAHVAQQQQPGGGADQLDPASAALTPQLLTPMAHALLAPSVDIQRLAAAAASQQQQQQQQQQPHYSMLYQQPLMGHLPQQQQAAPATQPWGGHQQQPLTGQAGSPALGTQGLGGMVGPGGPAAASLDVRREAKVPGSSSGPARKEPPLCLFCPMQ